MTAIRMPRPKSPGVYFDGTYEWEWDGDEWTPLNAPMGMGSWPEKDSLTQVVRTFKALDSSDFVPEPTVTQSELEAANAELARINKILDEHLPTIMFALGEEVYQSSATYKSRDELTEREVAMRSAYSAVHWIAKEISTGNKAEPLYDLPSVIDLMKTRKTSDARATVAALQDAAHAVQVGGIPGLGNADSIPEIERIVKQWLEVRAARIARETN